MLNQYFIKKSLANYLFILISCTLIQNNNAEVLKSSDPIILTSTDKNSIISGKRFSNILEDSTCAILITGGGPEDTLNIEITNCLFENVRWAIKVWGACKINIHGNRFENCGTGALAANSQMVKIEYNEFTNIGYHKVRDHGLGNYWAQQASYFIEVRGDSNSISHNIFDYGDSSNIYLEDIFGLWNSGGSIQSPCILKGNKIRGGIPGSSTGTGIIVGDAFGASTIYAKNIKILDNIFVNTQSIAIGAAGGYNIEMRNNRGYISLDHSSKLTQHPHNPEDNATPGGGIMIFDYSKIGCSDFTIFDNAMYTVRSDNVANPWWFDNTTCSGLTEGNNSWHWDLNDSGALSKDILPENMFEGLSEEYFSGKESTMNTKNAIKENNAFSLNNNRIDFKKSIPYEINIYDFRGRILKNLSDNKKVYNLNTLNLVNGVYQLKIKQEYNVLVTKFTIK